MRFVFVGDVALGDHPKTVGFGFYSKYRNGIPMAKAVKIFPDFIEADITFGNLEFALDTEEVYGNSPRDVQCKGVREFVRFLEAAGFDVLSVANNHIYEGGIELFANTLECLGNVGIRVCGTPRDFRKDSIIEVGDETALILGWCERPRQGFRENPPYNEVEDVDSCLDRIREAKTVADVVCVSLHWGDEFIQIPSDRERLIARRMIKSGAKIVIGHHPHVLREIEEYNGGLIAYSLGNFIGDMVWNRRTRETGCLFVEFKKGSLVHWKLHPAFIGNDFFPVYLDEDSGQAFMSGLSSLFVALQRSLKSSNYTTLAKKALRRHQALTSLFFLKNMHKYRPNFVFQILRDALVSRLGY